MKDRNRHKANHRPSPERESDDDSVGPSAIRSKSYIVPGNPLAPQNIGNWDRHVENIARNGGRHFIPRSQLSGSRMGRHTPARLIPIPRTETPVDIVANTAMKPLPRKPSFLPEIDKKYLSKRKSPDLRDSLFLHHKADIPETAELIKTTTSAVSFTLFYGPPKRPERLEPITRFLSDHVTERRKRPSKKQGKKKKKFIPLRSPRKLHRSGGAAMDTIRQGVEENRRQREQRNLAVTQSKLEQLEERAARIGTPDVTSRVQAVRETQDRLREENYVKNIGKFIKKN